ncbi:MAG: hypothetical protein KDB53_13545, partial [Planctomycetes bacterium]|nr:hypothetical protein [Planctomycetota bacterium]
MNALLTSLVVVTLLSPSVCAQKDCEKDIRHATKEIEKQCRDFLKLKDIDWKKISREFLREAKKVESDSDHLVLLVRLLARLEDGHAAVMPVEGARQVRWPEEPTRRGPGFFLCRIGDDLVVKNAWGPAAAAGIEPGMTLERVDKEPAEKWFDGILAERRDLQSFSTDHQAFFAACHWGLALPEGTRLKLEFKELSGKSKRATLTCEDRNYIARGPAFPPKGLKAVDRKGNVSYARTEKGFGYIHLRRCPGDLPELVDEALGALENPPGLILDFRGN